MLDFAFGEPGLEVVAASVRSHNTPSVHVLKEEREKRRQGNR